MRIDWMHIPDGLMAPLVAAIGWAEFVAVMAAALWITGRKDREKDLPRIAVLSAGIFVAQMINFPIGGGTTGHLIGGALFAILAGPSVAIVGMTIVILIQALMFGDGGVSALGLNALNMAIIAPLTGWGTYTLLKSIMSIEATRQSSRVLVAVSLAAWASVFVAAAACAAELAVSYAVSSGAYGIAPTVSIPAMLGYHAVIGVGEGIITAGVLAYVWRVSPGMFKSHEPAQVRATGIVRVLSAKTVRASLAIVLVFALALPLYFLYASDGEDGLEKTMTEAGAAEGNPAAAAPFSYGQTYFGALFAGLLGFLSVSLVAIGLLRVLKGPRSEERIE